MPTIRALLDRFGEPPPEIALDWAWQLRQVHGNSPDASSLLEPHSWTDVEIDADGRLDCGRLSNQAIQAALADLEPWAQGSKSEDRDEPELTNSTSPGRTKSRQFRKTSRTAGHLKTVLRRPAVLGPVVCGIALLPICGLLLSRPTGSSGQRLSSAETLASPMVETAREAGSQDAMVEVERLSDAEFLGSSQTLPVEVAATQSADQFKLDQLSVDPALSAGADVASLPTDQKTPVDPLDTTTPANDSPTMADDKPADGSLGEIQTARKEAEKTERVIALAEDKPKAGSAQRALDLPLRVAEPWVLTRDVMRYRVTVPARWNLNDRTAQWILALEPVDGLTLEPQRPKALSRQGLAVWTIFDSQAKSPRSFLTVRAVHHPRDHKLEIVFCGGAEDFPGLSIPLAERVLSPLTLRVQSQAFELRGALAAISNSVITVDQVTPVLQRKQAMAGQMLQSARLGAVLPEVNRLVELIDGQVNLHVALKSEPDQPPIATWGQTD